LAEHLVDDQQKDATDQGEETSKRISIVAYFNVRSCVAA